MKIVIIGGVATGAATATRIKRQMGDEAEVLMIEKSSKISFSNCGLPYAIDNFVKEEDILKATPASMKAKGIDVLVKHEVQRIYQNDKTLKVKNLTNNRIIKVHYDKLVLAMGAKQLELPIEGLKEEQTYSLKTFDDLQKIKENIVGKRKALIIGGGNVGVEVAETLSKMKINTTLVEADNRILGLDFDMSSFVEEKLRNEGIKVYVSNPVEKIIKNSKTAILKDGTQVEYDIILTTGITPNSDILKNSKIRMIDNKFPKVNKYMQTSDSNIYAGGDLILTRHAVTNKDVWHAMAWNAIKHAQIIADHICGYTDIKRHKTVGTSIAKVFDLAAGKVGLIEREAVKAKIPYRIIMATTDTNIKYMKNAGKITMKLLIHAKNHKILGVQAWGSKIDKRLDVFATLIMNKGKVTDLENLNLAYNPEFNIAIPIENVLGQVWRKEERYGYTSDCPAHAVQEGRFIIDTRSSEQHKVSHLKGAKNIPTSKFSKRTLPKDLNTPITVHCNSGFGASLAAVKLKQMGYTDVKNAYGGNTMYQLMKKKDFKNRF